jgi:cytochrome P450
MLRFCEQPEIPALLRERPELIPQAVEELLRAWTPHWASANRDAAEFENPDTFDLARERNRHITFGAGPHRCVGSNLARMNLRIALEEVVRRLTDIKLMPGADIGFHSTFNRVPLSVPITCTPGKLGNPA